jgi:xanthine dehydrogenase molybdopterin-binding subunit B
MAEMKKKGRGIACMWYPVGFTVTANPGAVTVKMNEDGTVMVLNGTVEIGQGSTTVLAQIAAEGWGYSDVTMIGGYGRARWTPVYCQPDDLCHRECRPPRAAK